MQYTYVQYSTNLQILIHYNTIYVRTIQYTSPYTINNSLGQQLSVPRALNNLEHGRVHGRLLLLFH